MVRFSAYLYSCMIAQIIPRIITLLRQMSNPCWDSFVQGLGLHYTYSHISDEKRRWVQLHQRVALADIVRQNCESYIDQHMMQTEITDRLAALKSLAAVKPHRDFYLTREDVTNIQAVQDKGEWRHSENRHESLIMWAQQRHPDVLVLQPQTPLPGAPDYDWDQACRQAAIAQDMPSAAQPACFYYEAARTGTEQLDSAALINGADALGCQQDSQQILTTQPASLPEAPSLLERSVALLHSAGQCITLAEDLGLSTDQAAVQSSDA